MTNTNQLEYTLNFKPEQLDWDKVEGLIPVIVQNYRSGLVLMQGFMNKDALDKTLEIGKVTFFSRTKQRLWTKGEESHHYLNLKAITCDCDNDCLLIAADPIGPTCHRGTTSCFEGHLALEAANIALFEPAKEETKALEEAIAQYKQQANPENAAEALKALIASFKAQGISLGGIDPLFKQPQK